MNIMHCVECRPGAEVKEMRKFITRVWEHPLLDQRTRDHRAQGRARLFDFLTGMGVPPQIYVGVLVGSSIWATNAQSDHDFMVVVDDLIVSPEHLMIVGELYGHHSNLHIANVVSKSEVGASNSRYFPYWSEAHLLLTPDEYISGSLNLARRLRLKTIDSMMQSQKLNGDQPLSWQIVLQSLFNTFYKYWAFQLDSTKFDRRNLLFQQKLQERSMQSRKPDIWQARFLDALHSLQIPPLEVFHQALTQTQGALKLDQKYSSQGIRNLVFA